MSNKTFFLPDHVYEYLLSVSLREPQALAQLREETARDPMARMQIAPEQGQFMALLMRLMGARRTIEVGVYTGYSSLAVALALPPDGEIIACDVSEEWTAVAQRHWAAAGVADKIDLRLAPALDTLDELLDEGQAGGFDFVFIDADKGAYADYYERALALVRPRGLIALDNTLWSGSVAELNAQDEDTLALRALNEKLYRDARVAISMLPIADGLTLALKLE
jgi:predicted O-methyltransferase YrrM